jgi:N-methylhydantoinase A
VEVAVPAGELDEAALAELATDFHRRYEALYGAGAGFREARVEIVTYRVRTTAVSAKPDLRPAPERGATPPAASRAGARPVYWAELGDFEPTPLFWGEQLEPGNRLTGPAIIQVPDTTIVVHPGQAARLDPFGNVLVDLTSPA